uniref:Uncharacterized protein n=1 Tax=Kalanchoe fedtschenkoi TaxID=63787 RepID=A0A7N0TK50_KALFE
MAHNRGKSFAAPASSISTIVPESEHDIQWPFGDVQGLKPEDLRETAYEIFFTSCRSSPGFGGRTSINYYPSNRDGGGGSPGKGSGQEGVGMAVTSRVKKSLGLKTLRRSVSNKRMVAIQSGSLPSSPNAGAAGWFHAGSPLSPGVGYTVPPPTRARRPLTSAEIMRQQMRVMEQSDVRLRKTLMRTLIGQMGRRAETIILPLELLRHLKPSEFNSQKEYHLWQKRQLAILENGLLLHPSTPLEPSNSSASMLRQIIHSTDSNPLDTSKNSEPMRVLCTAVVSLAWRNTNANSAATGTCHWADGYPLNIHIYTSLLRSIFDLKDETIVLDEVDEMLELMKKTWSTLGITREIHNLCFAFVLFNQYVVTSQLEPDLLGAALTMLSTEVAKDVKREKDGVYTRMVAAALASMQGWAERRLLDYHEYFHRSNVHVMESLLPLALSATRILYGDLSMAGLMGGGGVEEGGESSMDMTRERVDNYVRTSVKNAFAKIIQTVNLTSSMDESRASEIIIQLAKETEELASREVEYFSPILKKWHPVSGGIAATTLHNCYGTVLRQYLSGISVLRSDLVEVLERAAKLERILVQIVVEDSENCDDGGKGVVREMTPYEVDSIISELIRKWLDDNLMKVKDCINRAKDTETWNPKSKSEPYAYSGVELMGLAKNVVDEFFEIPICMSSDLVIELADGLDNQIQDYITFVACCGSKESYIPSLPPLKRSCKVSKIRKLLDKAGPCSVVCEEHHYLRAPSEGNHHPRPSTSRGTQRLYIRLNTIHFLQSHLNSLDKTLSLSHPEAISHRRPKHGAGGDTSSSLFQLSHSCIQSATHHVSEVAGYRLIFLDSNFVFYDSLYVGSVAAARIKPTLQLLKQNLSLLFAMVTDRAQPLALRHVMKASLEAFLMVLLAGGSCRIFQRTDQQMIEEDLTQLTRLFCTCEEGLVSEDVVQHEAEGVEDIVELMARSTEQLVEDFSILACEATDFGMSGLRKEPPPSTGMWTSSDPNTILRILCGRDDRVANQFLKKTFQLGKRR